MFDLGDSGRLDPDIRLTHLPASVVTISSTSSRETIQFTDRSDYVVNIFSLLGQQSRHGWVGGHGAERCRL